MAKIISIKELRTALKYSDTDEVNACLGAALESATLYIEAYLKTKLTLISTNADLYPLSEYVTMLNRGSRAGLYLSNGNVDSSTIVVEISNDLYDWSSATALTSTDFILEADKGIVFIKRDALVSDNAYGTATHIRVSYTSGFVEDVSKVFKNTPAWMDECAKFVARELYKSDDDSISMDGELGALRLLEHYIRVFAITLRPMY